MDFTNKTVAIVGLGGLGGYVCEFIARQNYKKIILIDGDKFDESNLNRQLECNKKTLGNYKVDCYENRIKTISNIDVVSYKEFLIKRNLKYLDGCDLVFDCLDNIDDRLLLEKACSRKNITIVHGAIGKDFGNVCLSIPKSKTIEKIYKNKSDTNLETKANAVSMVSSIMVEVAEKFFNKEYKELINKLIYIDLNDLNIKILCI